MSPLTQLPPEVSTLRSKLERFVLDRCVPAELEYDRHMETRVGADRWSPDAIPPCVERLKSEAKVLGLWNLFLPRPLPSHLPAELGPRPRGLTNREYGILCEVMGKSFLAPEVTNCGAPDTGNMEVLLHFGSRGQQTRWLVPLLRGEIRSAFLMTEPGVASSDATNIETRLTKMVDGGGRARYVLNGRKWWSTGAMDPRCEVLVVLAKMDYSHPSCGKDREREGGRAAKHGAHTVVLVPRSATGVEMVRALTVFGRDDAPHGHAEVALENVELDESALVLGEGRGFEIAQARLGPGRIHHCMRAVGMAARCYDLMLERSLTRRTFGKLLWEHGMAQLAIAESKSDLECARLLTLNCAADIDERGARGARDSIASIKVTVPELTGRVADRAVQVFGGAGVSDDFPLARILAGLRTLRIADGPDDVHRRTVAAVEAKKAVKRLGLTFERSRL